MREFNNIKNWNQKGKYSDSFFVLKRKNKILLKNVANDDFLCYNKLAKQI